MVICDVLMYGVVDGGRQHGALRRDMASCSSNDFTGIYFLPFLFLYTIISYLSSLYLLHYSIHSYFAGTILSVRSSPLSGSLSLCLCYYGCAALFIFIPFVRGAPYISQYRGVTGRKGEAGICWWD